MKRMILIALGLALVISAFGSDTYPLLALSIFIIVPILISINDRGWPGRKGTTPSPAPTPQPTPRFRSKNEILKKMEEERKGALASKRDDIWYEKKKLEEKIEKLENTIEGRTSGYQKMQELANKGDSHYTQDYVNRRIELGQKDIDELAILKDKLTFWKEQAISIDKMLYPTESK